MSQETEAYKVSTREKKLYLQTHIFSSIKNKKKILLFQKKSHSKETVTSSKRTKVINRSGVAGAVLQSPP